MSFPGSLSRVQFATGLLIRSVKVNGDYLLVDNCTINQTQEIDMNKLYIQGGPGRAIANIGAKKFTGELSFPIRVDRDNVLEPAVRTILQHAENPMYSLTLDTNHMLSYLGITAENGGTNDNDNSGSMQFVRIEYCGIVYQPNQEINGLTLGSVGRSTMLDNIQVSYCNDDAFEWFAGTVNAKHLVSYRNVDDEQHLLDQ